MEHKGITRAHLFGFYAAAFFLLSHAIVGLLYLKTANPEIIKSRAKLFEEKNTQIIGAQVTIDSKFFLSILVNGILYLLWFCWKFSRGTSVESTAPFVVFLIFPIQYYFSIKHNKKRRLDEREKMLLYKTISIAASICVVLTALLFEIKNNHLFGLLVNDIWGIVLVPGFFIFWGIAGFISLKMES
jgi:hypothetical protein